MKPITILLFLMSTACSLAPVKQEQDPHGTFGEEAQKLLQSLNVIQDHISGTENFHGDRLQNALIKCRQKMSLPANKTIMSQEQQLIGIPVGSLQYRNPALNIFWNEVAFLKLCLSSEPPTAAMEIRKINTASQDNSEPIDN